MARVPSREWGHDLDALAAAVDERTRIVYLANPNNPTGTWFDDAALDAFLATVPGTCGLSWTRPTPEYVTEPGYPDGIRLIEAHPNLVVTRTFSKIHASPRCASATA